MFKNLSLKILSLWMVIFLLLPVGLQFAHSFQQHESNKCTNQDIEHFHNPSKKCGQNHIVFETHAIITTVLIELLEPKPFLTIPQFFVASCNEIQLFSKSSRAPPTVTC